MTLSIRTLLYDVLLLLELGLFFVFFAPLFLRIFNAGNLFGMAVSAICFLLTLFHRPFGQLLSRIWGNLCGKCVLSILALLLTAGIAFAGFCSVKMVQYYQNPPQTPCTVIVLGCKVKGTVPSLMLQRRLEAAKDYLQQHPGRGHLRSTGDENLPDRCRHCSRPDSHGRPFHRYPWKLVIQQTDSGATGAAQPDYHSHGWLSSIPCPSHGDRTGAGKLVHQRENQTHSHPDLLGTGMDGIIRAISRHGIKIPIFLCVSFWAFGKNQVKSNIPPLLFRQNFAIIERVLSTPIKNSLEESVMRSDPYPRRWMQDQK